MWAGGVVLITTSVAVLWLESSATGFPGQAPQVLACGSNRQAHGGSRFLVSPYSWASTRRPRESAWDVRRPRCGQNDRVAGRAALRLTCVRDADFIHVAGGRLASTLYTPAVRALLELGWLFLVEHAWRLLEW
jgi:hypothetical protein